MDTARSNDSGFQPWDQPSADDGPAPPVVESVEEQQFKETERKLGPAAARAFAKMEEKKSKEAIWTQFPVLKPRMAIKGEPDLNDKLRPKAWDDFLENEKGIEQLKELCSREEMPNIVISGPRGSGRTAFCQVALRRLLGEGGRKVEHHKVTLIHQIPHHHSF
jgi:hypothetical protein